MDQMLPSPGFSIPSIGTPLHQPEEDQQIIANNPYQQFNQMNSMNMNSQMNVGGMSSSMQNMGLPSLMNMTPTKQMHSYQPSYSTLQNMLQPQTPVI